MGVDYKSFLDLVICRVPFVLDASCREDNFGVSLRLELWKGITFKHAFPKYYFSEQAEMIDKMLDELAYYVKNQVMKALMKEWQGSSDSSTWKGILRHDGFEKIIPLANPLPLIRYDIPASLVLDIRGAWDNEETMVPTLPQRRIEFHLQTANSQTRVAYYSSQR